MVWLAPVVAAAVLYLLWRQGGPWHYAVPVMAVVGVLAFALDRTVKKQLKKNEP